MSRLKSEKSALWYKVFKRATTPMFFNIHYTNFLSFSHTFLFKKSSMPQHKKFFPLILKNGFKMPRFSNQEKITIKIMNTYLKYSIDK